MATTCPKRKSEDALSLNTGISSFYQSLGSGSKRLRNISRQSSRESSSSDSQNNYCPSLISETTGLVSTPWKYCLEISGGCDSSGSKGHIHSQMSLPELLGPSTADITSALPLPELLTARTTMNNPSEPIMPSNNTEIDIPGPIEILQRAQSIQILEDEMWMSASLMDLVLAKFAYCYPNVHYFSEQFSLFPLRRADYPNVEDIIGHKIVPEIVLKDPKSSIVWLVNMRNVHWTMVRAVFSPKMELQFYDSMGGPASRRGGLSFRTVPRQIIDFLDFMFPLQSAQASWGSTGVTVVTYPHQRNQFDCGVACLLYSEKCGWGFSKEQINNETNQLEITVYRRLLQEFVARQNLANTGAPPNNNIK